MAIKRLVQTIKAYKGRTLDLNLDVIEMTNGKFTMREYIQHKDVVAIIAVTKNNNILLVKQDRYPIGPIIELPAGLVEDSEVHIVTALRELEEETGYKASTVKKLCTYYTSVGYTDEKVHLYLATDLVKTKQRLDTNEDITVIEIDLTSLHKYIESKDVKLDSKILVALNYINLHLKTNSSNGGTNPWIN